MRITVRGWGRDLGKTEIMSAALVDAEEGPGPGEHYDSSTAYLNVVYPEADSLTKVHVSKKAELRLGGNYLLEIELSRTDITLLFFKTHSGAIVRMFRSFLLDEAKERSARQMERWARMDERRRQRLAQEEQTKPQGS